MQCTCAEHWMLCNSITETHLSKRTHPKSMVQFSREVKSLKGTRGSFLSRCTLDSRREGVKQNSKLLNAHTQTQHTHSFSYPPSLSPSHHESSPANSPQDLFSPITFKLEQMALVAGAWPKMWSWRKTGHNLFWGLMTCLFQGPNHLKTHAHTHIYALFLSHTHI